VRKNSAPHLDDAKCHDHDAKGLVCARSKAIHLEDNDNNACDCQQGRNDLKGDSRLSERCCTQCCVASMLANNKTHTPPTHLHGTMQLEPDRPKLLKVAGDV
jgi:hypothetical protein